MNIDGYCALGIDREYDLTQPALLTAMDKANVDRAVIAPVDRFLAVNNKEGNDFILENANTCPDRFIPACSVNPWYGNEAVEELRRAVNKGAKLLVLHPFVQGYLANDELVWPLLEEAEKQIIPVYIHTGPPGNSTPWQVVDIAERFSSLDFIMGHCGATDFWNDVISAVGTVNNIYLESSLARPFAFHTYLDALGCCRGIMGSFAPLNDLCFEWRQMRKELSPDKWSDVYGANLLGLLQKKV